MTTHYFGPSHDRHLEPPAEPRLVEITLTVKIHVAEDDTTDIDDQAREVADIVSRAIEVAIPEAEEIDVDVHEREVIG